MCEEIQFLIQEKGLEINKDDFQNFFSAPLWGTKESAAGDAVIVFYSITRNAEGYITDADFNFVCRSEFNKTYTVL